MFRGSASRVVATLVVVSPQNPSFRELASGPASMVETARIAVRRGLNEEWLNVFTRATMRHWSRVLVRCAGGVERVRQLNLPSRYYRIEGKDGRELC